MITNPFDNVDGRFLVLVNDENQHSIWPVFAEIPSGWQVALAETDHASALAWVDEHWTDMRPRSLAALMDSQRVESAAARE